MCVDLAKHILTPQQFIVNARENKPLLNTYTLSSPCITQLNKKIQEKIGNWMRKKQEWNGKMNREKKELRFTASPRDTRIHFT